MHTFNENDLTVALEQMPDQARVAFAAAVATRQVASWERFVRHEQRAGGARPVEILVELWAGVRGFELDSVDWTTRLQEVMELLESLSDNGTTMQSLAEDSLASLAYAIRCRLTLNPQEAVWAARRAYEASDQAVIRLLNIQPGSPDTEVAIVSHAIVQRELIRQRQDLGLLASGKIVEVEQDASESQLLTDGEAAALL
jgi:uncharacterized protein YjaG (DUF416 family)